MSKLDDFINILIGHFDNSEQYNALKDRGISNFPFAEHINTICNDKIMNLPENFNGIFLIEESYYTINGKTRAMPHLFLFIEEKETIKLISYEIPNGYDKTTFTYAQLKEMDYFSLKQSERFTPAIYVLKDGIWEGGSVSMFSPTLKFTLFERFSADKLEVSESMETNGKRTFGYDEPIIYKRK